MKNLLKRFGFAGLLLGMLTLAPLAATAQEHNVYAGVHTDQAMRRAPVRKMERPQIDARSPIRGRNDRDDRGVDHNPRQDDRAITPVFQTRR